MNEKQWEKFFELVDKIVQGDGAYREKAEEVKRQAKLNGSEGNWEELLGWFDE